MAKFSLSRYDTQARVSVLISILSFVFLVALTVFVFSIDKGFRLLDKDMILTYGPTRKMLVYGSAGMAMLLGVIGFGMGFNSAGQRRNDKPTLSWVGFFLGALVLSLVVVLLVFFRLRGEPINL